MSDENSSPDDYFAEIESHFAYRRGTPFLFSGKDWALLKSWHQENIPLAVVLEAIDGCFDSREKSERKGVVSSLSYCRHAVIELWTERKQQLVGKSLTVPEVDPRGAVGRLSETLRSLLPAATIQVASAIETSANKLDLLARKGKTAPAIEEALIQIETDLMANLLEAISEDERDSMIRQIDEQLARFEIVDEETRRTTRDANLRRVLRQRLMIPRLSLFG